MDKTVVIRVETITGAPEWTKGSDQCEFLPENIRTFEQADLFLAEVRKWITNVLARRIADEKKESTFLRAIKNG